MKEPTLEEIADRIRSVLAGELTRRDVSVWVHPWVTARTPVHDEVARGVLERLGASDIVLGDGTQLYADDDLAAWLHELDAEIGARRARARVDRSNRRRSTRMN